VVTRDSAVPTGADVKNRFIVTPASALAERCRLFAAISRLLDTEFVPEGAHGPPVVGRIEFGKADRVADMGCIPTLTLVESTQASGTVVFGDEDDVPRPFRRRVIRDSALGSLPPDIGARAQSLLAKSDLGRPVWLTLSACRVVASAPDELEPNETLRSRFRPGRFSDLLPLLAFVRRYAVTGWISPTPSAAFVIDDPNLHATRYGFVDFAHLADHAVTNGYHVAFATIPLDLWWANQRAVRLFHESSDVLSLLVHGNDHVFRELDGIQSDGERIALLAEAHRRVVRFERRYGVPVARVMAPPHGACSHGTARALLRSGFEALCVSRTHPWLVTQPSDDALTGSRPVHLVDGELPLVLRYHISQDRDELAFRAFLDQPLVVYGHHDDLAGGPAILAETAAFVNELGPAKWESLERIVRSRFSLRRDASCLLVRPQTRTVEVDVPAGIDAISIDVAPGGPEGHIVVSAGDHAFAGTGPHPVGPGRVTIQIRHPSQMLSTGTAASKRFSTWPILRRAGTETRDRLAPYLFRRHGTIGAD
jgi:hypothetical protein